MLNLTATASIQISATSAVVWDALTNPTQIANYLFGTRTTTTWQPGSPITFEGEFQGQPYLDKGMVQECNPEQSLSYTYWSGFSGLVNIPENYSLVTYTMKGVENGILLTVSQTGFANEDGQKHSIHAWENILQQIKTMLET